MIAHGNGANRRYGEPNRNRAQDPGRRGNVDLTPVSRPSHGRLARARDLKLVQVEIVALLFQDLSANAKVHAQAKREDEDCLANQAAHEPAALRRRTCPR